MVIYIMIEKSNVLQH